MTVVCLLAKDEYANKKYCTYLIQLIEPFCVFWLTAFIVYPCETTKVMLFSMVCFDMIMVIFMKTISMRKDNLGLFFRQYSLFKDDNLYFILFLSVILGIYVIVLLRYEYLIVFKLSVYFALGAMLHWIGFIKNFRWQVIYGLNVLAIISVTTLTIFTLCDL